QGIKGDISSDAASHSLDIHCPPTALADQCNDLSTETQTLSEPPEATSNSYDHVNETHGFCGRYSAAGRPHNYDLINLLLHS
ncbi:hypothetical protein GBAR_LOCUS29554, partial [Geodia barretti]